VRAGCSASAGVHPVIQKCGCWSCWGWG
jgi:hypothetical protein